MQAHTTYETVIGLEIHVQVNTNSKIFCSDAAAFGAPPNTQVSAVSLAHPGTLPRLNRRAVENAIRLGLALGCNINKISTFDRKNYFYPDLPKGYQITQDKHPICLGGFIPIRTRDGERRRVPLHHIHLEEDAGKSIHDQSPSASLIDLNRAGVPLLEIVTEPALRSPDEAAACIESIRRLVRWLDISDGNLEEGSLRCDLNVSIRPAGASELGPRCEIKNVNSMRFARRALEYEVDRQIHIIEHGGQVESETRGFNASEGITYSLREKEAAHDYRYFPEPDLPPVRLDERQIDALRATLPPLPETVEAELLTHYGLPDHDVDVIAQDLETVEYYRTLCQGLPPNLYRTVANLLIHKLKPWIETHRLSWAELPAPEAHWHDFLHLIEMGKISASGAYQRLFPLVMEHPDIRPTELAQTHHLLQQDTEQEALEALIEQVLAQWPDKVQEYRRGKKGLLSLFMGELMKATRGKMDPKVVSRLLEERLRGI